VSNTITSDMDGACLDIYERVGPSVTAHLCNGQSNEKWTYSEADGSITSLQGGQSKLCLSAGSAKPAPGPPSGPTGTTSIWMKRMSDGKRIALVLVNEADTAGTVTVPWSLIGASAQSKYMVRDLWKQEDIGSFSGSYTTEKLASHAAQMVTLTPEGTLE
jgi:hypothetical protein